MKKNRALRYGCVIAVVSACFGFINCGSGKGSGAQLQSIIVTPANATLAKGTNQQFAAQAVYSDGTQQPIADGITWNSGTASVASITAQGDVTAMGEGASQISATYQGVTGNTYVTVGAPVLVAISVTPTPSSLPVGETEQLTATGAYSDGSTQNITQQVMWTSSAASVVSVNATGSVQANAGGSGTITAASGSVSGNASVNVGQAALLSISVTPAQSSLPLGENEQMAATGNYSDGSTQDLTQTVSWTASGGATVGSTGSVVAVAVGSATITASVGSVTGSAALTVQSPTLVSIAVTPSSPSIPSAATTQFAVTGTYNTGTTQDLTSSVTWSSSAPAIATVNAQGLATGNAFGTTTITASAGSLTASANLSVTTGFLITGSLNTSRQFHTATMLNNGMVLIAGGVGAGGLLASAELYDPVAGTFTPTGNLNDARSQHTATLLQNGTVLIAGGTDNNGSSASVEIYNPANGTFTAIGSLNTARTQQTATLLQNGNVLIAGGLDPNNNPLASAELFNQWTGTFTLTANLNVARYSHTATLLNNGQVLIAGGNPVAAQNAAEIYDPPSATFTSTANLNTGRFNHTATLLNDGTVLIAGGTAGNGPLAAAEIFNLSSGLFTATANLNNPRYQHTAVLMNNGTVLIAGGMGANAALGSAEIYDPVATTFLLTGSMYNARAGQTGTLLNNGQPLVAGGYSASYIPIAELYQPGSLTPPNLVSIAVTPANPNVPAYTAQPMIATGTFNDGSTEQLASATWSSNNAAVTITNDVTDTGAAYGAAVNGSANVTACTGSICGSTAVTVGPPALVSISVTPANPTVSQGWSLQFTATGNYSDGSTSPLAVNWSSLPTSVATITATGLATGQNIGGALISATNGTLTGSTNLTVSQPVMVSLALSPSPLFMAPGTTVSLQAIATMSSGFTEVLPPAEAAWSINGPPIATVTNDGTVTALVDGTTAIVAQVNGFSASVSLTVASISGLTVTPSSVLIGPGETTQFQAIATLTDGTTENVTPFVSWISLQQNIAIVSNSGLVTAIQTGSTSVTAQTTGFSGSAAVNVAAPVSLSIVPSSVNMVVGGSQQLQAIATMSDGSTQNVTSLATWTSTQPAIVTVNATGLVVGAQVGSTSVSAQYSGVSAFASINVLPLLLVNYFNTANAIASGIDGTLQITNPGLTVGTPTAGYLCAMIYVFDSQQEMDECCGCPISDSGILTLSLLNDLTANTMQARPAVGSVYIVPSDIGSNPTCDPQNLSPTGMLEAWETNDQPAGGGSYQVTETPYSTSQLTSTTESDFAGICGFIEQQGSGAGTCTCGSGEASSNSSRARRRR
jgi:uncharacterized protein YjdB